MKQITDFIRRHKIISIIFIILFCIMLLDAIINKDFTDFKYITESFIYLVIMIFILFFMVSKKEFYCPKCNSKLKNKSSVCKNCGLGFNNDENKIKSKRIILKSKVFLHIGGDFMVLPLAMGFLYLIIAPIFGAISSNSFSISSTLLVFYTSESLLPISIVLTLIGLIFVIIGFLFKKNENKNE